MRNDFKFYSNTDSNLTPVSAQQAEQLISKFNVYFRSYSIPTDETMSRYFDWDNGQDTSVYQLDNLKSFDEQYKVLKTINFPNQTSLAFYTDYKQNSDLVRNRIDLASAVLKAKGKVVNQTNLVSESKQKKEDVKIYLESLEKYKTNSLFDF